MIPPAAPAPMITKSTSVELEYFFIVVSPFARLGLLLRVVIAERRSVIQRVVVADELPAGFVVIAPVFRPRQESEDGVLADHFEEGRLLDGCQRLDLLFRCEA